VGRIVEPGTILAVYNFFLFADYFTLMREAIRSSENFNLTRAIWRHVPEDGFFRDRKKEERYKS
jgi:hypothetical protein